MKLIKKIFSLSLGILTFIASIPSAFATKNDIVALVIGTNESKSKFSRIAFDKEIEFGNWGTAHYNEKTIRFCFSKNNDETKISKFIKNCTIKTSNGINHMFNIIIATVDTDQNIEQIKTDIRNMVDFICDNKDNYTQILVVGCSDRTDILNTDKFMSELSNYVTGIEVDCTPNKWGTTHNVSFDEQFLCFTVISKNFENEEQDFLNFIVNRSMDYYELKRRNSCGIKNTIYKHPIASAGVGALAVGALCGIGYGIYKGGEYLLNKAANSNKK
ncbi:MAG: hypothetical protein IJG00_05850 [Clostridia bacterium]|nr:hypothetical protein [Clostridia bacterium]